MIVVETFLRDLFSQLPNVMIDGKEYPVNYSWGSQDDLNLFMVQKTGNKYPLIWLVQDKSTQKSTELSRYVKLVIAVNSKHKTNMNPIIWDTEFVEVLNPLFENVLKCFKQSGITTIIDRQYDVYREANYSEYSKEKDGYSESKAKTIDHWNVITFEAKILFTEATKCIQKIKF